jgi:cyclic dehypoxanthinyl futalosine synthase
MIAMSRIMLPNIRNIQASWLTVGKKTAQLCLHAGANDFGSIMLEEDVVSAAGTPIDSPSKVYRRPFMRLGLSRNCAINNMNGAKFP